MDPKELVEKLIDGGKNIVFALDEAKFDVRAAFWFYLPDNNEWRLIIASPYVDKKGPKKSYKFIQKELSQLSLGYDIKLENISVISPQDELIRLMKIAIRTGPKISMIRFTRNAINNVLIEDALIYRMM